MPYQAMVQSLISGRTVAPDDANIETHFLIGAEGHDPWRDALIIHYAKQLYSKQKLTANMNATFGNSAFTLMHTVDGCIVGAA